MQVWAGLADRHETLRYSIRLFCTPGTAETRPVLGRNEVRSHTNVDVGTRPSRAVAVDLPDVLSEELQEKTHAVWGNVSLGGILTHSSSDRKGSGGRFSEKIVECRHPFCGLCNLCQVLQIIPFRLEKITCLVAPRGSRRAPHNVERLRRRTDSDPSRQPNSRRSVAR